MRKICSTVRVGGVGGGGLASWHSTVRVFHHLYEHNLDGIWLNVCLSNLISQDQVCPIRICFMAEIRQG